MTIPVVYRQVLPYGYSLPMYLLPLPSYGGICEVDM